MHSFSEAVRRAHADRTRSFVAISAEREYTIPEVAGATAGELRGVPFAAKDNIDTRALPTTANTPALLGMGRQRNNPVVARLLAAGAQLVGKTNTHELALGITTSAAAFPATLHPVDPMRSPGGSSGGSAAAVAAGIVPFALGTDTGGSISIPASWCGVFGFRPTTGRWPSGGIVPLSPTRDTVGVIAESAELLELVDRVVCNEPGRRRAAATVSRGGRVDTAVRLGVPLQNSGYTRELDADVHTGWVRAQERLCESGLVELVPVDTSALHRLEASCGTEIEFFEISHALSAYLGGLPIPVSFRDLLDQVARSDVGDLLSESARFATAEPAYASALRRRLKLQSVYTTLMADLGLAGLLYPSVPRVAPRVVGPGRSADPEIFAWGTRNVNPGSVAGHPVVSLPAGRSTNGLPVGISIEGLRSHDRALLALARQVAPVLLADDHVLSRSGGGVHLSLGD
ncbi:mandelamide amidase [Leucobacter luti]|uniref:Mandelamide amidase n=1 Tax=Leucobacter luti TaxID=340320 RepID=A0A4V3CXN6_9MICO|nr:amidase family protein [Leucobacter luti]TDP90778.1 mandelamide amidase [Leucobacter luti]